MAGRPQRRARGARIVEVDGVAALGRFHVVDAGQEVVGMTVLLMVRAGFAHVGPAAGDHERRRVVFEKREDLLARRQRALHQGLELRQLVQMGAAL